LEQFGFKVLPTTEPEGDVSTEPALQPEDTDPLDQVKPSYDHNEETSLEDIEAKVYFVPESLTSSARSPYYCCKSTSGRQYSFSSRCDPLLDP